MAYDFNKIIRNIENRKVEIEKEKRAEIKAIRRKISHPYEVMGERFKSYDEAIKFVAYFGGGVISCPDNTKHEYTMNEKGDLELEVIREDL